MTEERYKATGPMLDDHERELLVITIEECGEVIEQATDLIKQCTQIIYTGSKTLRFGKADLDPDRPELGKNVYRLSKECGDLRALIRMLLESGLLDTVAVFSAEQKKPYKVLGFLQTEPSRAKQED